MQLRPLSNLLILVSIFGLAGLGLAAGGGCAGVKQGVTTGGAGTGGNVPPPINGLTALSVAPPSTTVSLTMGATGITPATVNLTATGTINGSTQDVTSMVQWLSNLPGASVAAGVVTVSTPGSYTITAKSVVQRRHVRGRLRHHEQQQDRARRVDLGERPARLPAR
jgi:hypothetical protein